MDDRTPSSGDDNKPVRVFCLGRRKDENGWRVIPAPLLASKERLDAQEQAYRAHFGFVDIASARNRRRDFPHHAVTSIDAETSRVVSIEKRRRGARYD